MKECPHCLVCFADLADDCPLDGTPLKHGFAGEPIIDGKYRVERRLGRGGMGVCIARVIWDCRKTSR
jgi:hypothetical protein